MSGYINIIRKDWKFKTEALVDDIRANRDKTFFRPSGTQVYVGRQGSGKTISAVAHLLDLKERYPHAVVVTNLSLTGMKAKTFNTKESLRFALQTIDPREQYIYFQSMDELALALTNVNNGKFGVIYLVDEIHTYFNALESKNIPMFVFTEISQQRKQRKLIIGTSQLFLRLAKPFREQCDNVIVCETRMNVLTRQTAYDGMTLTQDYEGKLIGNVRKVGFFFQTRRIRNAYDTFQKVVSAEEQYEAMQAPQTLKVDSRKKIKIA